MTFMHEFQYTAPGGGLIDPSRFGEVGPVESVMNVIRAELGSDYGQRLSYPSRKVGNEVYLPFNPSSKMLLSLDPPSVPPNTMYIVTPIRE